MFQNYCKKDFLVENSGNLLYNLKHNNLNY